MSSTTCNKKTAAAFVRQVWRHYESMGRHTLPWRQTHDPYTILVSELMLQQTQVDRVIPKFTAFMAAFPTVSALAAAPLSEVLRLWQGLGYNRRAKYLHDTAKQVVAAGGTFPSSLATLRALPGVGPYTAGAVMAFAYEEPVLIIETNIRTVYLHHFYPETERVSDESVLACVEATLPKRKVRDWYYALMDYGAYLKRQYPNPSRRSKHHTKQSAFAGSDRQIRGAILRVLMVSAQTAAGLCVALADYNRDRVIVQLEALRVDGLVTKVGRRYELPT